MVKLGFDTQTEHGTGVFLTRLRYELEKRDAFSVDEPDVWIHLAFEPIPEGILARKQAGKTKLVLRMSGCYCSRYRVVKKLSLPVVDEWYSKKLNLRKNALIVRNLQEADEVIYQSEFARRLAQKFLEKPRSGQTIYNGVPVNVFQQTAEAQDNSYATQFAGRMNILVSHDFRPYHRLHDAMAILATVKKKTPAHLHIVGHDDGETFAYAKKIADKLKLKEGEDYTFWGAPSFDELARLYKACQVMLNLSYWDSCPNVVIEGMACGLPIVGVDHGGVGELIGDAGLAIKEKIPFTYLDHMDFASLPKAPVPQYARAILEVQKNPDQFRTRTLGRARAMFDIGKITERYLGVAERLANPDAHLPKNSQFPPQIPASLVEFLPEEVGEPEPDGL